MKTDFWTILASVSQAAAALGTFLTVLVATRQWRRQWRPRLQVSVDTMFTVPRGAPREHFVQVEVLNVGIRSVIVTGIFYRAHPWAKARWFVQPDFAVPITTRLPAKIDLGEAGRFLWRPADWEQSISGMLIAEFKNRRFYRRLWRRLIICEVKASTGELFRAAPTKALLDQAAQAVARAEEVNLPSTGMNGEIEGTAVTADR